MRTGHSYQPIRVGLFSNEPIRLTGLTGAFEDHPAIDIVVDDFEVLLGDTSVACLILDAGDDPEWMDKQLRVRRMRPDIRLAVLGPAGDEELVLQAIRAGARAYLDLNCEPFAVRQALEVMMDGSIWAPRRVLAKLLDRLLSQSVPRVPVMEAPAPAFSPRERQVLDLIMTACSNREIAEELGIEERTVKAYVTSLMRKTGVDNRVSLSVRAMQGLLREPRSLAI